MMCWMRLLLVAAVLSSGLVQPAAAKSKEETGAVIEDVNAKVLQKMIDEEDYVAVFWYGPNCAKCDQSLADLESIDDDTDDHGVHLVKIHNAAMAKTYNIKNYPALTYFRFREPIRYQGDLTDEEEVLNFLTSLDTMELPDQIEEVNGKTLEKIINENEHVAAFFYQQNCKTSQKILAELEKIDDEADDLDIAFVKSDDDGLAEHYQLSTLPALAFFSSGEPEIYEGDLLAEEQVLEWLIKNKKGDAATNGGENSNDVIEDVNAETLNKLAASGGHLAVLFYKQNEAESQRVLVELENVDDECDQKGISFVRIDDDNLAKELGIEQVPTLVYFEKNVPSLYDGDLSDEEDVLKWLVHNVESDEIEDVTDEMLDVLIKRAPHLAVLFYDDDESESETILAELEHIDDECDQKGIAFVKIDNLAEAKEYGIDDVPALIYFEHGIPSVYAGNLYSEEQILNWLYHQVDGDAIEDVTDEMLDMLIQTRKNLAVLFYDKDEKSSLHVLDELEKIDDECDQKGVTFVKIDDPAEASEYGIDELPALVYFEFGIPNVYEDNLSAEEKVLDWLSHHVHSDEIEDVTNEMLDMLIKKKKHLAVLFYNEDEDESNRVLSELENIDDECDQKGITFVRIDDPTEAQEYGIEDPPALVYFENGVPSLYEGDLSKEEDVLSWLTHQVSSEEIEDVTDEMLDMLIHQKNHLAVLFYDQDEEESTHALAELENIDDECDQKGISFVRIDNSAEAKEYGVDDLPALVYFEKGVPALYDGDLSKEEEVLDWLAHQYHSDEIEDITDEMLDMLVDKQKHLAVLFYESGDAEGLEVLTELENIDDECDQKGISFVRISNLAEAKEYGIDDLPALVYFENGIPSLYDGELTSEGQVLDWLSHQVHSDEIEDVTDEMLDMLIEDKEHLAVVFYDGEEESVDVLAELEHIDDDCDQKGITFIKINNPDEAKEYGIDKFPFLVYFENKIPFIYSGDLTDEDSLLSWLVHQVSSEEIEDVNDEMMDMLIGKLDNVAVLFYDKDDPESETALAELENIDDECDMYDINFVKIDDPVEAREYGIDNLPALVYFENAVPHLYEGNLSSEEKVLIWLYHQTHSDEIEDINDEMLDMLIKSKKHLAVLFYEKGMKTSKKVLDELEKIDDECDEKGIFFVRIADSAEAEEYGIDDLPGLVYFEDGIPSIYEGDLTKEENVLDWLSHQLQHDEIEEITNEMLDILIKQKDHLAVLFYNKAEKDSADTLVELETIDDECDEKGISFVRLDSESEEQEYGIEKIPALIYFERGIPSVYDGDLSDEEQVLQWLIHQLHHEEIEDVTDEMLDILIGQKKHLAVLFYDEGQKASTRVLEELENIDDECDEIGMAFVKIDDEQEAREYGIDKIPGLVYFEDGIPALYEGDLTKEEQVLKWLSHQVHSDEIEDVTDEMLDMLIQKKKHLAVLFYDEKKKGTMSMLSELEKIDDECDQIGIAFVRIDSESEENEYGIDNVPALVYFESGIPALYEGDLNQEEAVLEWLTHQVKHEEIEDVTDEMLDMLILKKKHLAVLFYDGDEKESLNVLAELENIDDECDQKGISFVRIDSETEEKEYGLEDTPVLVYFENRIPSIYNGDLTDEEQVLAWLTHQLESEEIEDVTDEMLDVLIGKMPNLAVLFYDADDAESQKVQLELEHIDDECDQNGITFVKIDNADEAKEYGIDQVPALVYFENGVPDLYEGDLTNEEKVLIWLYHQVFSDEIEDVTDEMLDMLIDTRKVLAVLFYDGDEKESKAILDELEHIDDDCDKLGITFVKIDNDAEATEYGIEELPALVYFEDKIPTLYEGDLMQEEEVLDWLTHQLHSDEIEEVTDEMLDKLIDQEKNLAVLFYEEDDEESMKVLAELEKIDDECDQKDVPFVRVDSLNEAKEYGIEKLPALVFFGEGIPIVYTGDLAEEEKVLQWLTDLLANDAIEDITEEMLDKLIEQKEHVAVLFYDKDDKVSKVVLNELENIDDELDSKDIAMVRIDDDDEAQEYGIDKLPTLVYFESGIPSVYTGDLRVEEEVLAWLLHQQESDEIEGVTDEMLDALITQKQHLAVLFYNADDEDDTFTVNELEKIDDDCDRNGIPFVKISNLAEAEEYGFENLPILVYFENKIPNVYEGDLIDEQAVLEWLVEQKLSDTIEEVTDELLANVIKAHETVGVYFSGPCDEGETCHSLLEGLENIDDEAEDSGIPLVTTEEADLAKSCGITTFPTVAMFQNGEPVIFEGDVHEEEEVLDWLIERQKSKPAPGSACKLVGLEDERRHGKLRRFQCCPMSNEDDATNEKDDDAHDEL